MNSRFPLICIIIGVIIILAVLIIQEIKIRSFYHPVKDDNLSSNDKNFIDTYFYSHDYRIHAWHYKVSDRVILLCHGNAGNIGDRKHYVSIFKKLGYSTFMFDYRGYGKSEGRTSEFSLYQDTYQAYLHLINKLGYVVDNIVVYGESLGNYPATRLATKVPMNKLVLQSPFLDAYNLCPDIFKPLLYFSNDLSIQRYIKDVKCPILFMHSQQDEIIPFSHSLELYKIRGRQKSKIIEVNGGHNSTHYTRETIEGMATFLQQENMM